MNRKEGVKERYTVYMSHKWSVYQREKRISCMNLGQGEFTVTAMGNWIIGAKSLFGNPFDGKTLKEAIKQTEELTNQEVERIGVDRGYRGKTHHPEEKETLIAGRKTKDKGMKRFLKKLK